MQQNLNRLQFSKHVLIFQFPLGFGIASTIRIGHFLGGNKADGPRETTCVALITVGTWEQKAWVQIDLTFSQQQPSIFSGRRFRQHAHPVFREIPNPTYFLVGPVCDYY